MSRIESKTSKLAEEIISALEEVTDLFKRLTNEGGTFYNWDIDFDHRNMKYYYWCSEYSDGVDTIRIEITKTQYKILEKILEEIK